MTSTLYRGGRVRTPADPFATAMLVADGAVAWVGQDAAADALGAERVVDLDDAWVAPAFVDAHVHCTATGHALTGLDLTGCASLAEALRLVAQHAKAARGGIVLGTGWDDTDWPERRPPTAQELDRASFGGVVYLARTDVHSAVASSALLAACPEARAEPGFMGDGLVREQAHHAVRRAALSSVGRTQRRALQEATLDHAASLGIACLHECGGPEIAGEDDFLELLALDHAVQRIGYWGELGGAARARDLGALGAAGDLFADGSLGSSTACLEEPYLDGSGHGDQFHEVEALADHIVDCTEADLQAGFHAIGDRAVRLVGEAMEAAAARVGEDRLRGVRHRLEHLELPPHQAIATFARLGVVGSVQPAFDARWGGTDGMYALRLGRERALASNPLAALAAAGLPLAFGSDSPVTALDPWGTLRAAVRHHVPSSSLSGRAAFAAHTRGGWRAARRDKVGELVPGAPATFAVWQVEGELVVEAPDEGIAGWSTDPRSGVPGLPDLDGPDPICLRTVVAGRDAYVRG